MVVNLGCYIPYLLLVSLCTGRGTVKEGGSEWKEEIVILARCVFHYIREHKNPIQVYNNVTIAHIKLPSSSL